VRPIPACGTICPTTHVVCWLGGKMRVRVMVVAVGVFALSGVTPVFAGGPGPDGNNNAGLCEAAGSGSPNGQDHKQDHGEAFQALLAVAESTPQDEVRDRAQGGEDRPSAEAEEQQDIRDYCSGSLG